MDDMALFQYQELNRKVLEELQRLVARRDEGLITEDMFYSSVKSIWNIATGIVAGDVSAVVSACVDNSKMPTVRKLFLNAKSGSVICVEHDLATPEIVNVVDVGSGKGSKNAFEDVSEAVAFAQGVFDRLTAKGFVQINK